MLLSETETTKVLREAAQVWNENRDYFSEIDSRFGNGDYGVTISRIAGLTEKSLDGWDDGNAEIFLEDLGDNTIEIGDGSVGPLYGAMIGRLSGPLGGSRPIDAGTLREIFMECLSAMEDITNVGVGDKTMMDALIPIVKATQSAENDVMAALEATKEAAAKGAKESGQHVSKYSRARSYKKKTIGTPDAGVVSISLFFAGFCNGLEWTVYGSRWCTDTVNKIKRERQKL